MGERYRGSCLCGQVRFAGRGAPKWIAHCHCRSCRKATGAAFATLAGFDQKDVEVIGDAYKRIESSPGTWRGFCASCGSSVSYESDKFPGELHLSVALFDEADQLVPGAHVYMSESLSWLHLADDLPKFDKFAGAADTG